ncbi:helix-turn-helix domain-containing protein [Blastococcus sp. CCUG 61487]|uniref:helix-turn-helix domain-containing protein n=1 Tax=Blastococcus sp. CCUG 61487 TaxID=1840703 RepID=UPI0010C012D6|nr:helix-turn-helix domain-containing protein [Blastococcus sp. CCUG 61487]
MSVKVSSWVWEHSKTGGGDRLLLLAIADNADDDGDNAWPSVATLARKTQTSDRTVQRGIERLVKGGCVEVSRGAGRGGTHRYRVLMTAVAAEGCGCDEHAVTDQEQAVTAGDNLAGAVENPSQGGVNLTPVNLTEGVTQLRHRGGDTAVSPERPERPRTPPNPPARRGAKCDHGRTSGCRRCGTNPRAAEHRELLAAAEAAAAQVERVERDRDALPWCGDPACYEPTRWRTDSGGTARCHACHPDVVVGRPARQLVVLASQLPALRARAG